MSSVLIVGAGVFGQVIAAQLRVDGHQVTVFDRREEKAGSPPSGGHIKPSWLTAIDPEELAKSLETLDRLFGIETLICDFLKKQVSLQRVDVPTVLNSGPVVEGNVKEVGDGFVLVDVPTDTRMLAEHLYVGTVIVAAGVWSSQLLPQFNGELYGRQGMSWVFQGGEPVSNMIQPWAPYKQIVRTSHGVGLTWLGDGTAIKPKNWTGLRVAAICDRVMPYAPKDWQSTTARSGIRPYMTDGLRKVADHLWLATGGGKSGMALAGVYANKLSEALR